MRLPDFPWDLLKPAHQLAHSYPDGSVVNLSVGSPVDPVDPEIAAAGYAAATQPGYPTVSGTEELRAEITATLWRRYHMGTPLGPLATNQVLPVIGTKECIASLARDLGCHGDDLVVIPPIAYPTYEVSALLASAAYERCEDPRRIAQLQPKLIFLNTPANPHGAVLSTTQLREILAVARNCGAVIVSDECYLGLGWDTEPISILNPTIHEGDLTGILAVHSLSKTSNMASYRSGFLAGDADLIAQLLALRRHTGMMVPTLIQHATIAALRNDAAAHHQKETYRLRRTILRAAIEKAGFTVDSSEAGLYLWATRGTDCWEEVNFFARRGIIVAPGSFYGPQGAHHVRLALTATDADINTAAIRLEAANPTEHAI